MHIWILAIINFFYIFVIFIDCNVKINPVVGDIVKVLSPLFQGLYRAKIVEVKSSNSYEVFYIDFGNIEIVQSKDIFELSDNLKKKVSYR